MVLNNDVKMINQVLPFCIYMDQEYGKVPYDRDNQNQTNVSPAKCYMLSAFPENFFETDNYTDVRKNKCNQECDVNNGPNRMMTSEC